MLEKESSVCLVVKVVEPARQLSVLPLCALVPKGLRYVGGEGQEPDEGPELARTDFDWETNRMIAHEVLEWLSGQGRRRAPPGDAGSEVRRFGEYGAAFGG